MLSGRMPFGVPGAYPAASDLGVYDDEFSGTTLDPKWQQITTAHVSNASVASGKLTVTGAVNTKRVQGFRQVAPTGSFTVKARLQHVSGNTNDLRNGIAVYVPGGKGHVCGPFAQDSAFGVLGVTTTSETADWSAYDGTLNTVAGAIAGLTWFRIIWEAGPAAMTFQYSNDNLNWTGISTRSGQAQPTRIAICEYSNSGAIQTSGSIVCDEFRVTTP